MLHMYDTSTAVMQPRMSGTAEVCSGALEALAT